MLQSVLPTQNPITLFWGMWGPGHSAESWHSISNGKPQWTQWGLLLINCKNGRDYLKQVSILETFTKLLALVFVFILNTVLMCFRALRFVTYYPEKVCSKTELVYFFKMKQWMLAKTVHFWLYLWPSIWVSWVGFIPLFLYYCWIYICLVLFLTALLFAQS